MRRRRGSPLRVPWSGYWCRRIRMRPLQRCFTRLPQRPRPRCGARLLLLLLHAWCHMVMVFPRHKTAAYMHLHVYAGVHILIADDEGTGRRRPDCSTPASYSPAVHVNSFVACPSKSVHSQTSSHVHATHDRWTQVLVPGGRTVQPPRLEIRMTLGSHRS